MQKTVTCTVLTLAQISAVIKDCLLLQSIYESRLGFQAQKNPKNPTMLSWEIAMSIIHYFMVSET